MLPPEMQSALNGQIKAELAAGYLYLSMAAYCEAGHLPGIAHWLEVQANEELAHAMRFYRFINDRDGRVVLQTMEQPQVEFAAVEDVFATALEHEQENTGNIDRLYQLAVKIGDYASQSFLQGFIIEQVEEEKTAGDALAALRMAGGDTRALLLLDREMAGRSQ